MSGLDAEPRGSGRVHPELSTFERTSIREFNDMRLEWRRLFSELFGTYLLVTVAAGAGVVDTAAAGSVGRIAGVAAPGLMVMAVILFMGAISGAHLNPVVTIAFAFRTDFAWRRVPGYLLAQFLGAALASVTLFTIFGQQAHDGATLPGSGFSDAQSLAVEALVTLGLVSTVLGAASGAQNIGPLSALAAGGYVILAGLWASPVSGASMNPARSFGPALVSGDYAHLWVYFAGPVLGMLIAVGVAYVLRGGGGDPNARKAAEGNPHG